MTPSDARLAYVEAAGWQGMRPLPGAATFPETFVRSPRLAAKAAAALAKYLTTPPRLGCRHVVMGGVVPSMCAQHPAAGLVCARCYARHGARHVLEEEKRCDGCEEVVDQIAPVVMEVPIICKPTDTRGRRREIRAVCCLVDLGLCDPCKEHHGRDLSEHERTIEAEWEQWEERQWTANPEGMTAWVERLGGLA